ncbi:hypothetical protein IHE45_02G083100 [Dioscorea alata]|uniref:Uncharacterized protein n=1 Tax=Dioscorea alata TaxID=55571 RepID=A0ACB7WRU4_DIOAL|nr:hypothetical protein IHE45_02G083100 [Dioscorea alata]
MAHPLLRHCGCMNRTGRLRCFKFSSRHVNVFKITLKPFFHLKNQPALSASLDDILGIVTVLKNT